MKGIVSFSGRSMPVTFQVDADGNIAIGGTLYVDADGNVGIGGTPSAKLQVKGDSASYIGYFRNDGDNANRQGLLLDAGADDGSGTTYYLMSRDGNGDNVGYLANTAGTFALTDPSDERLKEKMVNTSIKGLEAVNAMKVRDFNFKKSGDFCRGGFIAQELVTAFPEAVNEGEDGMLGVSRDRLVPVLVKAIQELTAKVEALEAR